MHVSILNINYFNDAQCTLMYLYNKSVKRSCSSLNCLCLNKSFNYVFRKEDLKDLIQISNTRDDRVQTQYPNYG